jgi:hypothetical protein
MLDIGAIRKHVDALMALLKPRAETRRYREDHVGIIQHSLFGLTKAVSLVGAKAGKGRPLIDAIVKACGGVDLPLQPLLARCKRYGNRV